jgi:hypothetical protein
MSDTAFAPTQIQQTLPVESAIIDKLELLRSYALIDLKRDKLTHQDLGQMQTDLNAPEAQVPRAQGRAEVAE